MNRHALMARRYASNDPTDGRFEEARERQLDHAREHIAEEYAGAIAVAARIEALAKEIEGMTSAIPANEFSWSGEHETWGGIADCLRDVVFGHMLADERHLEELADIRVSGEG